MASATDEHKTILARIRAYLRDANQINDTSGAVMSDQPETLTTQPAYEELREIGNQCSSVNWDGDGAEPIEADTLRNAHRFLEALPPAYPMPSVTAEPDGYLDLEWYRATNWLLSVSVSADEMLYWAELLGDDDPRGRCHFDGEVPETILALIRRVSALEE